MNDSQFWVCTSMCFGAVTCLVMVLDVFTTVILQRRTQHLDVVGQVTLTLTIGSALMALISVLGTLL